LPQTKPSHLRAPAVALLAAVLTLVLAAPAVAQDSPSAQSSDVQPLLDRIDRLERDVNLLQRQVYRGTTPGGAPMPVNPPDTQSSLSNEVRIGQLEDQMRTLTGQLEEFGNAVDQIKHRLDTLSSDVDQRLTALEHGGVAAPVAGAAPAPSAATAPAQAAPAQAAAGDDNPGLPPEPPRVLGTLGPNGVAGPPPPDQPTAIAVATPPPRPPPPLNGSPQEQYNYAFGLLRQADYPGAEQALKTFVQHYASDPLAGNAQYWLGESYYVRKDYENAATAFAVGYQKYPKSSKAADDLLKLGMALGNLGKKQEACTAFARLDRDFPTAASTIKDREASERQQLGCS
jgi:tol-pal system protein YbgF